MRPILALLLLATCAPLLAAQQPARSAGVITGVVRDTAGQPVSQVRVSAGDTTRFAVTDSTGAFRLSGVTPGPQRVHFRRLGYVPAEFSVFVDADEDLRLQVELSALATALDPIDVTRPISEALATVGYYDRKRQRDQGILNGVFIDPEEIEQRRPTRTSHLFSGMPGVDVVYKSARGRSVPFLYGRSVNAEGQRCQPAIFIDGVEQGQTPIGGNIQMDVDLDMLINPLDIKAIEVYPFGSRVPERFQSMRNITSCGSVVIWTKLNQ